MAHWPQERLALAGLGGWQGIPPWSMRRRYSAERRWLFLEKVSDKDWQVNKSRNIIGSVTDHLLQQLPKHPPPTPWSLPRSLARLRTLTGLHPVALLSFWKGVNFMALEGLRPADLLNAFFGANSFPQVLVLQAPSPVPPVRAYPRASVTAGSAVELWVSEYQYRLYTNSHLCIKRTLLSEATHKKWNLQLKA